VNSRNDTGARREGKVGGPSQPARFGNRQTAPNAVSQTAGEAPRPRPPPGTSDAADPGDADRCTRRPRFGRCRVIRSRHSNGQQPSPDGGGADQRAVPAQARRERYGRHGQLDPAAPRPSPPGRRRRKGHRNRGPPNRHHDERKVRGRFTDRGHARRPRSRFFTLISSGHRPGLPRWRRRSMAPGSSGFQTASAPAGAGTPVRLDDDGPMWRRSRPFHRATRPEDDAPADPVDTPWPGSVSSPRAAAQPSPEPGPWRHCPPRPGSPWSRPASV